MKNCFPPKVVSPTKTKQLKCLGKKKKTKFFDNGKNGPYFYFFTFFKAPYKKEYILPLPPGGLGCWVGFLNTTINFRNLKYVKNAVAGKVPFSRQKLPNKIGGVGGGPK